MKNKVHRSENQNSHEVDWKHMFQERQKRHSNYFVSYIHSNAKNDPRSHQTLSIELENIQIAIEHIISTSDQPIIKQLALDLYTKSRFLDFSGNLSIAVRLLDAANVVSEDESSVTSEDINVLCGLGEVYFIRGEYENSIEFYEKALSYSRKLKDKDRECSCLIGLGVSWAALNKFEKAKTMYLNALKLSIEVKDRRSEGICIGNIGIILKNQGKLEEAIDHHKKALSISRKINDRRSEGRTLGNLGIAYRDLGELDKSYEFYKQALAISQELKDSRHEGIWSENIADYLIKKNRLEEAESYLKRAQVLFREIGALAYLKIVEDVLLNLQTLKK